ncbi:MAG: hypothetical protein M1821_006710 [Bathelium mastoideum]|nr:MAG: hypothetical protein M1821_006710 [Bathelium mastoideum]
MESEIQNKTDMATKGPRFPSDSQTPEQKHAFEETERIVKQLEGESFQLKDAQGNFLGPFGILSYTPTTFLAFLNYSQSFFILPHLTHRERELSVLATVSVTNSEYVEYAHQKIGMSVGLSQTQVERGSRGRVPVGLSDREECIYELALDLAKGYGTVRENQFDSAVGLLGKEGVAALAQLVGGYMLTSLLVNVADVATPQS